MFNIVPAIDLINGRAVRLRKGDFTAATDYGDPIEHARRFKEAGYTRLHLVDLDGARSGQSGQLKLLQEIVSVTGLAVDYSGGVSSEQLLSEAFDCGARQVCLGSKAVSEPELVKSWIMKRRPEQFILAVDLKDDYVAVKGWKDHSSLTFAQAVEPFLALKGLSILCTDINRDGMLSGPAVDLYQNLVQKYGDTFSIIASGGVTSAEDLKSLQKTGVTEVVVGKAFYEGILPISVISGFVC